MKTEMVSYCFIFVCEKIWWTYIFQEGDDRMNELYHYGVKGMKWGVRRFQNKDGSLTTAGKKRRIAKEASNYYKKEADKRKQSGINRIHEIDREIDNILTSGKVNKASNDKINALLMETAAVESSFRTLEARSKEIDKMSKRGERYIQEYKNNVPIDKLLKAYSNEYAEYQYNIKGDKEWLLNWDDKN